MKPSSFLSFRRGAAALLSLACCGSALAAGLQLTGQHAPASTPAMSPADAQKAFTLPPGFEARLFAAEPDVINPVAMTWDERGRLWVVELYEYPLGAAPGTKPRDRIIILEDTDGDGRADKRTVFADGLNLATGIVLGNGGAYVGQAPDLLFLKDTKGTGHADQRTVLLNGFGLDDRHELLNGFTWGPDGWIYLTHGVFTHSKVKIPEASDPGVTVTAAVARYQPATKKFEVFAEGTSNPWGVDFDRAGNAIISACVIDHLWHMAPGGMYIRQGGVPENPYAYELLPSIVDHKHFMAAYAGVQVYQGNQFPADWRGLVLMGNIHQSAVNCDRLTPNGSSFKAHKEPDFLTTTDGWFRPVTEQVGPDGALWIADWYDKYPCYQNARADPEGVDRERGRIWRIVYTGKEPGKPVPSRPEVNMDLGKLPTADLVQLLAHPNIWQRKTAQRVLNERRDPAAAPALRQLLTNGKTLEARLFALWTLHTTGLLDDTLLDQLVTDPEPAIRTWVARLSGERHDSSDHVLARLSKLADDTDPSVRLGVATACRQFVSGALTIDTPPATPLGEVKTGAVLAKLVENSADAKDPLLPFLIWMAAEPKIAAEPANAFRWLSQSDAATMPLSGKLAYKTMRRVSDLQNPAYIDAAIDFVMSLPVDQPLTAFALNGLVDSQKGAPLPPTKSTAAFFERLLASPREDIVGYARQLGTLWGDAGAIRNTLTRINDTALPLPERIKAVQSARSIKNQAARSALIAALTPANPEALLLETVRALGDVGGNEISTELLAHWPQFSPAVRRATAEILASRANWASTLLSKIEQQQISRADIPATAIRSLTSSKADYGMLARRAETIFGKVRAADADKAKIIAIKKAMILNAKNPPDINKGHDIARRTCFVCHKLYGEGADVGPDLTGVGRSTLDALLNNVIDPNQIVGAGYENVEVETKDDRVLAGRMVENNDVRVRLLSAGPKEDIIARSDIKSLHVGQMSLMPEGLEQMPEEDFRNLMAFILNPPQDNQPFSWKNEETPVAPKTEAKK